VDWGAIRTLLRRQLNEVTAQAWADADLDVYIQIALGIIQKEIIKYDPEAFTATELHNLVASTTDYTLTVTPDANLGVIMVERANDSTLTYKRQDRRDLNIVRDILYKGATSSSVDGIWALSGQSTLVVAPAPDAALTSGIRVTYKSVLTQGGDSAVPPLPGPTHWGIVLIAKLTALGETRDDTTQTSARLAEVLGDLGLYYARYDGENPQMRPDGIHLGSRD
jgi:hypothetical protein